MIRQFEPAENPEDYALLLSAYLEMFNDPSTLKYLSYTGRPFISDQVKEWFTTHRESGVDYFADYEENNTIRGIAVVKSNSIEGIELLGLKVRSSDCQHGIGRRLILHVLQVAEEKGFSAVNTDVFADNLPMLKLVISIGFIPVSITHHARYDGTDVVRLKYYFKRDL